MTTFQDVKWWFHYFAGILNGLGNQINAWPYPANYLASPFYTMASYFAWPDWIWNGLDTWISGIAADARDAWNYASSAYTIAQNALNAVPSSWTVQAWVASALGLPSLSWYYLITKIRGEITVTIDLSWLVDVRLPIINKSIRNVSDDLEALLDLDLPTAIADIKTALEAIEIPDIAAWIEDMVTLKTWRDNFLVGLDDTIADVISRTIDSILDRVEW